MIQELWQTILYNMQMVIWFIFPLVMCRVADIIFGSILAAKSVDLTFDWKVLWKSVIWSATMLMGIAFLVSGIVSLPEIMLYYKVEIVDAEILKDMVTMLMIITLFIGTTVTYGKDAFVKLTQIIKGTK